MKTELGPLRHLVGVQSEFKVRERKMVSRVFGRIVGLVVVVAAVMVCGAVGQDSFCADTARNSKGADEGCGADLPYCDSGDGLNMGNSAPGDICRLCSGRGTKARVDWNCPSEKPDCVDSSGSAVSRREMGDQCVCLLTVDSCVGEQVVDTDTCLCSCLISQDDCVGAEVFDGTGCTCSCPLSDGSCNDELLPDLNEDTCTCECLNPCSSFAQVGQDVDGTQVGDYFGNAVEISADGRRIVVGAFGGGSGDRGQARLFELQSGTWVQRGDTIEGDADQDRMGWSVDITADGTRIAVGADQNDGAVQDGGVVRVYDLDDTNDILVQVGGDIQGPFVGELSGSSVALSDFGTRVAIGATKNGDAGFERGRVSVFEYDSTKLWTQVGSDVTSDSDGEQMGSSVALSADGSILLAGTYAGFGDWNYDYTGLIKVFKLVNDEWVQLGSTINGPEQNSRFGFRAALSADGTILASGAAGFGLGGLVQVYQFSTTEGDWVQLGQSILSEDDNDAFGSDVDLTPDGYTMVIGGYRNDRNGRNSGHVQIYDLVDDLWVQVGSDIDGESASDYSGGQVSISADGSRVAIGATGQPVGLTLGGASSRGGQVRVFDENLICCSPVP